MSDVVETLKRARELIAAPGKWTQGAWGRDAGGNELRVHRLRDDANCFCLVGAIAVATDDANVEDAAWKAMQAALGADTLAYWNDRPSRTQAEVVDLFTKAIEAEEARHGR